MNRKQKICICIAIVLIVACGSHAFAQTILLQNGDFSQDMAAWTENQWILDASSIAIENETLTIYSPEMNDARLTQHVTVKANSIYHISADILVEGIEKDAAWGAWVGFDYTNAYAAPQEDIAGWQHVDFYAIAGDNQTEATLCLALGNYSSLASGKAQFRNVQMGEVSEAPQGVGIYSMSEQAFQSSGSTEEEDVTLNFNSDLLAKSIFVLLSVALLYLIWHFFRHNRWVLKKSTEFGLVFIVIIAGFAVRILMLCISSGYPNDTNAFAAWGMRMAEVGPSNFYASDYFCDYPPGIMYILGAMAKLCSLLNVTVLNQGIGLALLFIPFVLCDLLIALLVWQYSRKKIGNVMALGLCIIMTFHPVLFYDSAVWHQVDSIFALFAVLTFLLLEKDRKLLASIAFGLGVLCKPHMLMLGPLFALPFLREIFTKGRTGKGILKTVGGALLSVGVIVGFSYPCQGSQPVSWLLEKYFSTVSSYPYASVNAFNFWALLGKNYSSQEGLLGPLIYKQWGNIAIVVIVALVALFYFYGQKKEKKSVFLLSAFLLAGIFTFAPRMHERYSYAIVILLLFAYARLKDTDIFRVSLVYAAAILANMMYVLYVLNNPKCNGTEGFIFVTFLTSIVFVVAFVYLLLICLRYFMDAPVLPTITSDHLVQRDLRKLNIRQEKKDLNRKGWSRGRFVNVKRQKISAVRIKPNDIVRILQERLRPTDHGLHWKRKDWALCLGLTLIYGIIAFIRLGTTVVPESYWKAQAGQQLFIDFGQTVDIEQIWAYPGINGAAGQIDVYSTNVDQEEYTAILEYDTGNMYRWNVLNAPFTAQTITLEIKEETWLCELVFVDAQGSAITPSSISLTGEESADTESSYNNLFDEQEKKPDRPDVTNGMYFDELYHGRTAYEHLHKMDPYEYTHPPLGKLLIAAGIAIFGMNPFGWRCVGTLIGVLMVPAIYLLAKRIFKETKYAFFASFLFTFDFMHFVQTRIATIDVYGVFFIILMYYFMLQYWQMSFYTDGLKKTLRPLGLSGICFGLGAASKWICLYAGIGLAIIFFASLFKRYHEYILARSAASQNETGADAFVVATKSFYLNTLATILFCIIFFIIIPLFIYLTSYIPWLMTEGRNYTWSTVWQIQKNMFNYHNELTATHPFESKWWSWPLDIRPIYYYSNTLTDGTSMLPEGMRASIAAFGNPVVWWSGLIGLLVLFFTFIWKKIRSKKSDSNVSFILIGFAAQFIPWMMISRATFIYHYFASVPFIILALTLLLQKWGRKRPKASACVCYGLMAATFVLFVIYYPVLSGLPVQSTYLNALKLFSSWTW